jgi:crotonobetainyl-CoA:carnitine CoA-transferase CaiB-like acyl-CoA transferase
MFENIRVLDFSRALTGPLCTQMLAELGADVIKVEEPNKGDETRGWYPVVDGWSGYFMALNRSKRSMTLNLKRKESINIIKEMVKTCDVVVENFTPGVVQKLGISYEELSSINPKLIYLSLSAYGQTGPNKHVKGYDPIIQADAGAMSITGEKGGPPVKIMIPIADISSGMFGAFAIAGALYKRSVKQEGEYIDVPLYDSVVSLLGVVAAVYFYKGEVPKPMGSEHLHRVPSRNYRTGDGTYIHLICNDRQWLALCDVLALEGKFKEAPYTHDIGRMENREEIDAAIEQALLKNTGEAWVALLQEAGVPCGMVNSIDKVLNSEQAQFRDLVVRWQQEGFGEAMGLNFPYKFLNTETKVRRPVPKLGEHTQEILREYGFTPEQINEFKNKQVI